MSRRNQRKIGELLKRDARGEDLRLSWQTDVVYLHAVDLLDRAKRRLPLDDPDYEFLVMALEDYVLPAARGRLADQQARAAKGRDLREACAEYWRLQRVDFETPDDAAAKVKLQYPLLFAGKSDKTILDMLHHPHWFRDE